MREVTDTPSPTDLPADFEAIMGRVVERWREEESLPPEAKPTGT